MFYRQADRRTVDEIMNCAVKQARLILCFVLCDLWQSLAPAQ